MDKLSPVGVFDSGVGGFSVVKEIQKVLPGEDVLYYGDSANMPCTTLCEGDFADGEIDVLTLLVKCG